MTNAVVTFFSALPGGYRNNNGFNNEGNNGNWWSSTENSSNNAWNRNLNYNNGNLNRNNNNKYNGYSVLCVRDLLWGLSPCNSFERAVRVLFYEK
jgi:uncharacterized protein (TIGR02145 family)